MMALRLAVFLSLLLLASGCTSTRITNLTLTQQPRNSTGLYPFAAMFETTQHSLQKDTVQGYVMIGLNLFPMQPGPVLTNRWETLVPIPADQKVVHYRFKFEFEQLAIPQRQSSSDLSAPYRLFIDDPQVQ